MPITKKFAIYPFPFGFLRIEYEGEVVLSLKKSEKKASDGEKNDLTDRVYAQIMEYLEGKRMEFSFPYELRGTLFQKKVWAALCQIPYGETRSYKEIACAVGSSKACRAVGMANHRNPMSVVVPCHRVIGTNGDLVGYGNGLPMKKALLELEARIKKSTQEELK